MPDSHLWSWSVSELYGVVIGMFRRLGIFPDTMPVAEGCLVAFLDDVRAGYLDNPYHSFAHGVDVASVVYNFLHMPYTMAWLTPLDRVSMMIAALCHDIGHPGLNNVYQVNARTELAQRYENISVLERYSCDLAKELLEKHDLLRWIPQSFAELETRMCETIVYTDMKFHFELLEQLHQLHGCSITAAPTDPLPSRQRSILCSILLHAADISNTARPWAVSKWWSESINAEFRHQSIREREEGLPLSPGLDRPDEEQLAGNIDFAELVRPFYVGLAELIPEMRPFLQNLDSN
ncbi:hypothetical protein THASP1DRAFT_14461, partial [Thamnocephalis sphaerospora]